MRVRRLVDRPIVDASTHRSIGTNIQGPSLIEVPDWVETPLGRYYLYFADHKGRYIRLAYADALIGPWTVHIPGALTLEQSPFPTEPPAATADDTARVAVRFTEGHSLDAKRVHSPHQEASTPHIASPDVHVDHENRRISMYYHGLESYARQVTRVALSSDGRDFSSQHEILGRTYFRAFRHDGWTYAIAMPGQVYRSRDGLSNFQLGPLLFEQNMRHCAVLNRAGILYVFWTRVGDAPECILCSTIDLGGDWHQWRESPAREVLRPEKAWEGADLPVEPSVRSVAPGRVNQLRDPAIFERGDDLYLLYAVAGESGIAIASITI